MNPIEIRNKYIKRDRISKLDSIVEILDKYGITLQELTDHINQDYVHLRDKVLALRKKRNLKATYEQKTKGKKEEPTKPG
jgi:hypothetical protein